MFSKQNSCLIHISFDHEGIRLKEMKNLRKKTSNKLEKVHKIF